MFLSRTHNLFKCFWRFAIIILKDPAMLPDMTVPINLKGRGEDMYMSLL